MKLVMGEQQQLIESSVLSWLRDRYDFQKRSRSVSDPVGCLPEVWQQFAEMGWLGLPLPESAGGFGGGALETGLMMRAFGRHLVVEPFRACILLGARLLADLGRPDQRDAWLPAVVGGGGGQARGRPASPAPARRAGRGGPPPPAWRVAGGGGGGLRGRRGCP